MYGSKKSTRPKEKAVTLKHQQTLTEWTIDIVLYTELLNYIQNEWSIDIVLLVAQEWN